jgi:hypothetical protein
MRDSALFSGSSNRPYLLCLLLLCFVNAAAYSALAADSTLDLTSVPVANLIDDLTNIDAQAPGLHSTASVRAFIADNSPVEFAGGVIGSAAPKDFPQMKELVRRGVSSLPLLIKHLDDKRPTKLTVGGDFFMFRYFSDEYDPMTPASRERRVALERSFDRKYTVRVGDVCYALIGQIVNRTTCFQFVTSLPRASSSTLPLKLPFSSWK